MRTRSFCSALFVIVPAFITVGTQAAGSRPDTAYRPPVTAPVIDGFGQPVGPYSAGNRGLDYATAPGTVVRSIGDGVVVFAGTIAHQRYVTVLHRDGLRSSYSYLASVDVALGQAVQGGQRIGTAGTDLQLGVRRGDAYIDPARLFAHRRRPHLVRPPR